MTKRTTTFGLFFLWLAGARADAALAPGHLVILSSCHLVSFQTDKGREEPADLSKMRDITGIEEVPPKPPSPRWPIWLALGLVVAVPCLFGVWKAVRHLKSRPTPPLPADQWARYELDRLEAEQLPAQGKIEPFHTRAADVLRRYVEMRFDLRATRQTTPEFLAGLSQAGKLEPAHQDMLVRFLGRCDLAKFAPVEFSPDDCTEALTLARRFVEETRPGPSHPHRQPR